MGFVKVTDRASGKVLFDSRREELGEKPKEYLTSLMKALDRPGLEDKAAKVVEAAVKREHEERQNDDIERKLGWNLTSKS